MTDYVSGLLKTIAQQERTICRLQLENAIHRATGGAMPMAVLAEYFETAFHSDHLVLAVLRAEADPLRRHTSPAAALLNPIAPGGQQLHPVYYTRELLDQTEEICQACFLPRTGFLLFRADADIGLLLNPDARYVSGASIQCGDYLQELKAALASVLAEMDRQFPFHSTATLSKIWSGSADLYQMYLENKNTYDYSWNQPGNLHTYDEFCAIPMTPRERMDMCALEEEFINDINHLLFDEASIVLDTILQMHFQHATPLSDVTVSTAARLRSVLSALEYSMDLPAAGLEELSNLLRMTAGAVSVPELLDRTHDFFAAILDLSPRQHARKGVQILEFLEANYKNPALNAQMICDRFRISRTYLSRLIKTESGQGLVDCIHRIRLEHAKTLLLETDATIEQVAFQVGFSSRYSLIRAFRELEHTTPTEYRTNHKGAAHETEGCTAKL